MKRKQSAKLRVEEFEALPDGVNLADWSLERTRAQNPRIRTLLGSITLLDGVMESNYAILHCSPERLLGIWRRVREVATLLRDDLGPLLDEPSVIPRLEASRAKALSGFQVLDSTVLSDLLDQPEELPAGELTELRKLLCVAIGQIHGYLQDTFGRIMAADPRSLHDADYYLSRRFPQDIEEAEWLYATVERIERFLEEEIEPLRMTQLEVLAGQLQQGSASPDELPWMEISHLLDELSEHLVPKLKEVLALRGIRFAEMEILDRYTTEIPSRCMALMELFHTMREADVHVRSGSPTRYERASLEVWQRVFRRRMGVLMAELDRALKDLGGFIPLWLRNIEDRRALLLRRS